MFFRSRAALFRCCHIAAYTVLHVLLVGWCPVALFAEQATTDMSVVQKDEAEQKGEGIAELQKTLLADPTLIRPGREAIEQYLQARGETALTLLTAWKASGDKKWLQRAVDELSDDPVVQFVAQTTKPYSEQRAVLLERFRQNDPENMLPCLLLADVHFQAGRQDKAAEELRAAAQRSHYNDYLPMLFGELSAVYRMAFADPVEAEIRAYLLYCVWDGSLILPHHSAMKWMSEQLDGMLSFHSDEKAAEIARMASHIGRTIAAGIGNPNRMQEVIGMAMEGQALKKINARREAAALVGFDVEARMAEIEQQRQRFRAPGPPSKDPALMPDMLREEVLPYFEVFRAKGERAAMDWLAEKKMRMPTGDNGESKPQQLGAPSP